MDLTWRTSARDFTRGIIKRFWSWLPFLLLDAFDLWARYVMPRLLLITGEKLELLHGTLLLFAVIGVAYSALLTYHELRKEKVAIHDELTPTVEIDSTPILQPWQTDDGDICRLFYIAIQNPSARPLRGVTALLTHIEPGVENLDWLPIPLHIKHDNSAPRRETFDMNPRGVRHIDLVAKCDRSDSIEVCHPGFPL